MLLMPTGNTTKKRRRRITSAMSREYFSFFFLKIRPSFSPKAHLDCSPQTIAVLNALAGRADNSDP